MQTDPDTLRRRTVLLGLLSSASLPAAARSDASSSEPPLAITPRDSDLFHVVQSGVSQQATGAETAGLNTLAGVVNVKAYGAIGDDVHNDTSAIQAALDSGAGKPITVIIPPGTYKVYPADSNAGYQRVACLNINYDNVTIMGFGRGVSVIKAYASGGRDPNTNWDVLGGRVSRGHTIFVKGPRDNFRMSGIRLTGQCPRSSSKWPLGGRDPPFPGDRVTGDGWDYTHHGVDYEHDKVHRGHRIYDCEIDSYKGELVYYGGSGFLDFRIDKCLLHDSNADGISVSATGVYADNEIYATTQPWECSPYNLNITVERNYIHDNSNGITLVNQSDFGATHERGQCTIRDNLLINNPRTGIFLYQHIRNVWVSRNTLVDCGPSGTDDFGSITLSSSGRNAVANIYIDNNLIVADARSPKHGILVSDNDTGITGKYIRCNRIVQTPNAIAEGHIIQEPLRFFITSGGRLEITDNDFRATKNEPDDRSGGGTTFFRGNVFCRGLPLAAARVVTAQFNKINDTVVTDVPDLTEWLTNNAIYNFKAVLYVSANAAGGAKVAVRYSGGLAGGYIHYRAKTFSGATLSATGQATNSGAAIGGVTAAVDAIEIDGSIQVGSGGTQEGQLTIQFAQNASDATPSSVLVGSSLIVREGSQM